MTVDWSISIGSIVQIIVMAFGGLTVLIAIRFDVARLKGDVVDMKAEIKKVGEVLVAMAVQGEQISTLQKQVDELRHGRGFVMEDFAGKRVI
ncbi:MAG: hypothetical protein IT562_10920 [Alphaproteobacteria bacterium]|nr:hypothetical protein [Alphaproteobacteria bacterium]